MLCFAPAAGLGDGFAYARCRIRGPSSGPRFRRTAGNPTETAAFVRTECGQIAESLAFVHGRVVGVATEMVVTKLGRCRMTGARRRITPQMVAAVVVMPARPLV